VSALSPLVALIAAHVLAAERLHGDDTTVPVLARGKTVTGRLWVYVRDDLPFGGRAPPGAIFHYSPDRGGKHPCSHLKNYVGILQADAYAGFNDLYHPARKPGPIIEAACWAHGRRKLFVLADVAKAPLAIEAVRRIDAIFDVEREINGLAAEQRLAIRHTSKQSSDTLHDVSGVTRRNAWNRREHWVNELARWIRPVGANNASFIPAIRV
jgi:hypothetical protein